MILCPACLEMGIENPDWVRWESGDYTERHYLYTGAPEERHAWEDRNDDVMHSEPWFCMGQNHQATDEIEEELIEL